MASLKYVVVMITALFGCLVMPSGGLAEQTPFIQTSSKDKDTRALISFTPSSNANDGASLFTGRGKGISLLAPYRSQRNQIARNRFQSVGDPQIAELRDLISQAESRQAGYDAIQHGARIRPKSNPTSMSVGEIYRWISATPGQPHAIGKYQFIPTTLRRLVDYLNVGSEEVFTARLQDRLADVLFVEAGLVALRDGLMTRHQFMNNLAKIWAGLPTETGKSYYDGYAGNKASMTWAHFDTEMARIFRR
jgi:hypothetical protein